MRFLWKWKGKRTFHRELCLWTRRKSCRGAPGHSFYLSFFCQNVQRIVKQEFIKVDNSTVEHFIESEPELTCWVWPGWQASPFSQECLMSLLFSGRLFWVFSYPVQPGHVACYSHICVEEELAALLDFLSFYCFPRMTQWARSSSLVVLYPVYYLRSSHWLQCAFLSTLRSTLPLKALQALSKRLDPLSKIPLFSILTLLNITSSSNFRKASLDISEWQL